MSVATVQGELPPLDDAIVSFTRLYPRPLPAQQACRPLIVGGVAETVAVDGAESERGTPWDQRI